MKLPKKVHAAAASAKWTRDVFTRTRNTVRGLIAAYVKDGGPDERLAFIVAQIESLRTWKDKLEELQCYAYVLEALGHCAEHGGLARKDVARLVGLARAILAANDIDLESRLAFLRADLHDVLGRLEEAAGDTFAAAWEDVFAVHVARRSFRGEERRPTARAATLALRLGQVERAARILRELGDAADPVQRIRTLRLGGDVPGAAALAAAAADDAAGEVAWERLLLEAIAAGSPKPLATTLDGRGPHFVRHRVLLAYLFAKACRSTTDKGADAKVATLAKRKGARLTEAGALYDAALTIEAAYDYDTPLADRLARVQTGLRVLSALTTLDAELLFLAAAARWLSRAHAFEFASLVLGRYRGASLAASSGRSADPFGVVTDLYEREWFP